PGPQNDVTLKMPAFEWVHVQLHQQKGMISLSPPTICNSASHRALSEHKTLSISWIHYRPLNKTKGCLIANFATVPHFLTHCKDV
ncbi:hypothetical protein MLM54_23730, partial [Escherichia coli]|nr:hypothetical protein [Escherichia coli]MCV0668067.1 hypothetical protein [Escherichia coli]